MRRTKLDGLLYYILLTLHFHLYPNTFCLTSNRYYWHFLLSSLLKGRIRLKEENNNATEYYKRRVLIDACHKLREGEHI